MWEKPSYSSDEGGRVRFETEGGRSVCVVDAVQIQVKRIFP